MELKNRLITLRTERGMNQSEGAMSLGVSKSKYNKWETGANRPDYETVCQIADHYSVTTDYLLGYSDSRTHENAAILAELGLTDESIRVIKALAHDYDHYPLAGVINGKRYEIDQSIDKRSLLDVLNSMLSNENFYLIIEIIRSLTSPIPDRVGYVQWESAKNATPVRGKTPFDSLLYDKVSSALESLIDWIANQEQEVHRNEQDKVDLYNIKSVTEITGATNSPVEQEG